MMLRHAPTPTTVARGFPDDEEVGAEHLDALSRMVAPKSDRCMASPSRRAQQTADALHYDFTVEPLLSECDFGTWRGRAVAEIAEKEPEAFGRWLAEPAEAPHGGESLEAIAQRVDTFLSLATSWSDATLAVTHGGIIKIAVVLALDAPLRSMWRVRCDPLTLTTLEYTHESWELVSANMPLASGLLDTP